MLAHLNLNKILFLDIETVPLYPNFDQVPDQEKKFFAEKTAYQRKDDIDGSQVASVFYQEKNLERIITYCEKDVVTVAQVFLKLRSESLLKTEEIIFSQ
jgi:hypothetical protein